jgi:hypothetical protein
LTGLTPISVKSPLSHSFHQYSRWTRRQSGKPLDPPGASCPPPLAVTGDRVMSASYEKKNWPAPKSEQSESTTLRSRASRVFETWAVVDGVGEDG